MITGRCIMCRQNSTIVDMGKFSSNFTEYAELSYGEGVCEKCHEIKSNKMYRMSCWIIEDGITTFFKRADIYDVLCRDKKPPFTIYITKTFKTQGYLRILYRPNISQDNFVVGLDREVIPVRRKEIPTLIEFIKSCREQGYTKSELLNGPHTRRYVDRVTCDKINVYRNISMWKILVYGDMTEYHV